MIQDVDDASAAETLHATSWAAGGVFVLLLAAAAVWSFDDRPAPVEAPPAATAAFPWNRGMEHAVSEDVATEAMPSSAAKEAPCDSPACAVQARAPVIALPAVPARNEVAATFGHPAEWASWWTEQTAMPPQRASPSGLPGAVAAPAPSAGTTDTGLSD